MSKYSAKLKIAACEEYLSGEFSNKEICEKYGIHFNEKRHDSELSKWLKMYMKNGEAAFIHKKGNDTYSASFKEKVVQDYLEGKGSFAEITVKYNIRGNDTVRRWVLLYNANKELKDYCPNREVYMADARRKTSMEERKEIVKYCIEHGRDYKGTANIYDVSYNQVYSWVKKYDSNGEDGLKDRRGQHKTDNEVDELERLRRENARLKRQLREKDMLTELLKKVQEYERM